LKQRKKGIGHGPKNNIPMRNKNCGPFETKKKSVIVARNRKLDDLIRRPKNITRVSA
jgi:hypothetical protein